MKPYEFTVSLLNDAIRDLDGRVEVIVHSYGCPAQTYGPPEKCYPAEAPEWDLGEVEVVIGTERRGITGFVGWKYRALDENDENDKWLADLIRAAINDGDVAEHIAEQHYEEVVAAQEAAWEARRDARWEDVA